ncbi:hypothetical protein [Actinocorallia sp. A-T 12471]|uniref:hypothetical protein n=1 Tax=Actinocorallia sp. A-T 12471 TaxID=3089813 RepID=UPI0029CF3E26|nr:hypothetical protein [Actinocorallia sp. A-T 12471]MDX6739368.1 hypothetical protein [Actinocorallia sp. A-T 12471]
MSAETTALGRRDMTAILERFGASLLAEGFGVLLRDPDDYRPLLRVWNPATPGVGASVVIEVLGEAHGPRLQVALIADLGPCEELSAARRALSAVFTEWGLPLPGATQ